MTKIHVICDHQSIMMVVCTPKMGDRIVGPIPFDKPTRGNPYLVFGDEIRQHVGETPTDCSVTVSKCTSGDLEKF